MDWLFANIGGVVVNLFSSLVWFVGGAVTHFLWSIPKKIKLRKRVAAWPNCRQLTIFVGSKSGQKSDSTQFRSGDFFAAATLYGYIYNLIHGVRIKIFDESQISFVSRSPPGHLVLIGGPNNNVLSQKVLQRWNTEGVDVPTFSAGVVSFSGVEYALQQNASGKIERDYGIVIRGVSPLKKNEYITICMGIKSFGTHAASLFCLSDEFNDAVGSKCISPENLHVFVLDVDVSGAAIVANTRVAYKIT